MNIDKYKSKVIELFKSGNATEEQWDEMAAAILNSSESVPEYVEKIDRAIGIYNEKSEEDEEDEEDYE